MKPALGSVDAWSLRLARADLVRPLGKITQVVGLAVEVSGMTGAVGDLCYIVTGGERRLAADRDQRAAGGRQYG